MKGNLPAEKLYQKRGFEFAEEATIHYEDDGDTQAMMYEKVLQGKVLDHIFKESGPTIVDVPVDYSFNQILGKTLLEDQIH